MPELTQDEVRTLADGFFLASKRIGDFRLDHFDDIAPVQRAELRRLQHDLAQQSLDLTAEAIQITLDDLKPSLERIGTVTKQVNEAVTHLQDVHKVIGIATTFVNLGGAIASGNPGAVAAALASTVSAVEAA